MNKDEIEKLTPEQKLELVEHGKLFCVITLFTGIVKKTVNAIFCKATLVFAIVTIIMFAYDLFSSTTHFDRYLILAGVFVFYECIVYLLKNKTNINFSGSGSVSKNINK